MTPSSDHDAPDHRAERGGARGAPGASRRDHLGARPPAGGGRRPGAPPGVPEALPRTLALLRERVGPEALDRLWIFPPLVRGRKEWGVIAASSFTGDGRRRLITARYVAERTGRGLSFEPELAEEGVAPQDRFPRMIGGVVERGGMELGDPREVELGGDPEKFEALLDEFDPSLLEAT